MITVHVRLFAGLHQLIGEREIEMILPDGSTVAVLRDTLGAQHPVVQTLVGRGSNGTARLRNSADGARHSSPNRTALGRRWNNCHEFSRNERWRYLAASLGPQSATCPCSNVPRSQVRTRPAHADPVAAS